MNLPAKTSPTQHPASKGSAQRIVKARWWVKTRSNRGAVTILPINPAASNVAPCTTSVRCHFEADTVGSPRNRLGQMNILLAPFHWWYESPHLLREVGRLTKIWFVKTENAATAATRTSNEITRMVKSSRSVPDMFDLPLTPLPIHASSVSRIGGEG